MKLGITGASGYLGGFLLAEAQGAGDDVVALGRRAMPGVSWHPFDLAADPTLPEGLDALVHAAFDHLPGRYRGGEGDDPAGFLERNRDGSLRLFEAARAAGVGRAVFLSTRAVYGDYPPGTELDETMEPHPDTLYGRMKGEVEQGLVALSGPGFQTVSLRVTGVYGAARPGGWHKWQDMFAAFERGETIAPRLATEVHGADLAAAVRLVLRHQGTQPGLFNVSDLCLDQHDLLAAYARARRIEGKIPERATGPGPNRMNCDRLRALDWRPGGWDRLNRFLGSLG